MSSTCSSPPNGKRHRCGDAPATALIPYLRRAGLSPKEVLEGQPSETAWRVHRTTGPMYSRGMPCVNSDRICDSDQQPLPRAEHSGYGVGYGASSPGGAPAEAFRSARDRSPPRWPVSDRRSLHPRPAVARRVRHRGRGLGHPGGRRQPCSLFGAAPTVPTVGTHHPSRPHRSRNVLCCRYLCRIQAWRMPAIPQRTNSVMSSRDRVSGTAWRS